MELKQKKMNNFQIIKPFGPSILKVTIPDQIISDMNIYVDEIIVNKKKSENLNYGNKLVGNVNQEFYLEEEFMKKTKWAEFLGSAVQQWLHKQTGKELKEFKIIKSWIVRQFKNEYNPVHIHGGDVSGVGYLKVPNSFGQTIQSNNKVNKNGNLELIYGTKQFLSDSSFPIIPEVGYFYFFPHYMMHAVYPFSGTNEERRSISFNAKIDEKLFNVYGN